jgi:hypothetical protein
MKVNLQTHFNEHITFNSLGFTIAQTYSLYRTAEHNFENLLAEKDIEGQFLKFTAFLLSIKQNYVGTLQTLYMQIPEDITRPVSTQFSCGMISRNGTTFNSNTIRRRTADVKVQTKKNFVRGRNRTNIEYK